MFEDIAHPQKRAFLAAYATCGVIKRAAKLAGIARETHYDWMNDAEYASAFAQARKQAADALEDEAIRRAQLGTLEPVYANGQKIGTKRRYSDSLLALLLKARKPEYKDRIAQEHSGEVLHTHTVDLTALDESELDSLERIVTKARLTGGDRTRALTAAREQALDDVSFDGTLAA